MKEYDVIVVGGGIHGAGVLQAAAAAGHSALLIEKHALASGTSSRSSKLIHGGLRYLESGQFALVRESLHERAVHLRIAPGSGRAQALFHSGLRRYAPPPLAAQTGALAVCAAGRLRCQHALRQRSEARVAAARRTRDAQSRCRDPLLRRADRRCAADPRGGRLGALARRRARDAGEFPGGEPRRRRRHGGLRERRCEHRMPRAGARERRRPLGHRRSRAPCGRPSRSPTSIWSRARTSCCPCASHAGIYYVESPSDGRAVFVMPWQGADPDRHHRDPLSRRAGPGAAAARGGGVPAGGGAPLFPGVERR